MKQRWIACTRRLQVVLPVILFLAVLAGGAYVRFDHVTQQGMLPGDGFDYLREARLWAEGEPPDFLSGKFYRPVAYFLQGAAVRWFGYNDYSIKLLHGILETSSILMLFLIAVSLTGSPWAGVACGFLYAFLPSVVWFSRYEMLQPQSTFFVLAAFLCFVRFDRREKPALRRYALLFLSGLLSGLAANTHPDLAFLGPGYIVILLVKTFGERNEHPFVGSFLGLAGVFTLAFFVPYFVGFAVFGFSRVLDVFAKEFFAVSRDMTHIHGRMAAPAILAALLQALGGFCFADRVAWGAVLCGGALLLMVWHTWKGRTDGVAAHAPLFLILSYTLLYSTFLHTLSPSIHKVVLPLVPLAILFTVCWYWLFLRQHLGRYAVAGFIPLLTALFLVFPRVPLEYGRYSLSPYRAVYDTLKTRVNGRNRLLLAPASLFSFDRAFQMEFYFGPLADYQVNLPLDAAPDPSRLGQLLEGRNIRYVFVGTKLYPPFLDPRAPVPGLRYYREWLRNPQSPYSLQNDLTLIGEYIRSRGGVVLGNDRFGTLYELRGDEPQSGGRIEVMNGSFEQWSNGMPVGAWMVKKGRISRADEGVSGDYALRLEPGPGDGIGHLVCDLPLGADVGRSGMPLRVGIDVKARMGDRPSLYLIAEIDGHWQLLKPPGIVTYNGRGGWQILAAGFTATEQMKRIRLCLWMENRRNLPVWFDNLVLYSASSRK